MWVLHPKCIVVGCHVESTNLANQHRHKAIVCGRAFYLSIATCNESSESADESQGRMLFKRIHYKSGQIGQSAGLFFSLSNASFLPASSLSRRFISRSHLFVRAWRGSDESERDRAAFSCMRPFSVFLILLRALYRARKKCFCTWLGELYYYFCVTVLPCSCWVLLSHVLQTFISGSLYRQSCFFVLFTSVQRSSIDDNWPVSIISRKLLQAREAW